MTETDGEVDLTSVTFPWRDAPRSPRHTTSTRYKLWSFMEAKTKGGQVFNRIIIWLILLNVLAFVLSTVEGIAENAEARLALSVFEFFSVGFFTLEYLLRVWTCVEDPEFGGREEAGMLHPPPRSLRHRDYGSVSDSEEAALVRPGQGRGASVHEAFEDTRRGVEETLEPVSQKLPASFTGRLSYIFSFYGLIDLAAIVPFYIFLFVEGAWHFSTVARVLRVVRLMKAERTVQAFELFDDILLRNRHVLAVTAYTALALWIFYAALLWVAERNGPNKEKFRNMFECLWNTLLMLTGNFPEVNLTPFGRVVGALLAITAVGVFAVPTGILGAGLVDLVRERRKREEVLEEYLEEAKIEQEEVNRAAGLARPTEPAAVTIGQERVGEAGITAGAQQPERSPYTHSQAGSTSGSPALFSPGRSPLAGMEDYRRPTGDNPHLAALRDIP